jgi:hypothetical protein
MTVPLPRSAARQVALVVASAVLLSNLIVLGVSYAIDRPALLPGSVRTLQTEAAILLGMLDTAEPGGEAAVIATARSLGFDILPFPHGDAPAGQDTHVSRMIADAAREHGLAVRIKAAAGSADHPRTGAEAA